jgi:hypothetical protein
MKNPDALAVKREAGRGLGSEVMAISHDRDQLTRVERDIASAKERIAWHQKNIEKLTREGCKTDLAEAMLDSWERILLVFEQHREVVRTWLKDPERR